MEQPRKRSAGKYKSNDNDGKRRELSNTSKSRQELTYDVLRIIFKYLSGLDLSNASRVCRSWLEAANSEKRTRGPMCLTRYEADVGSTITDWEKFKKETIKCSMVKPNLALFFTVGRTGSFSQRCHCDFLPSNCDSISVDTYGVIINNSENTGDDSNNLVCMFLPEASNIKISTFLFNIYDWEKSRSTYYQQLKAAFETSSGSNCRKTNCLMLFSEWNGRRIACNLLKSSKHWLPKPKPCIWGGITRYLTVCNSVNNTRVCTSNPTCIAIVLSGTKMRTFSILLDANCNTKEKVENELKTFKDRVKLKKHSMGFMFACCIRGVKMFDEYNVESATFKQLFPSVPLVGCFGDGEFGKNIMNGTTTNKYIKWYNSVSTTFMILTYD